ncbi:MAG: hypothetical protein QXV22_05015 [Thermoplasmataceae archaeon]
MKIASFRMSKLGNKESDYEDALSYDLDRLKFAIADGASDSIFSDIWAEALTETFVQGPYDLFWEPDKSLMNRIAKEAREKWYRRINWASLPWFIRNKGVNGSFSTILLVQFRETSTNFLLLRAMAIGDSCIFKINGDKILWSFPVKSIREFGTSPQLVWSGKGYPLPLDSPAKLPTPKIFEDIIHIDEKVVIATDSASSLIFREKNIPALLDSVSRDEFKQRIVAAIDSGVIRNDDVTMAVVAFK